MPAKSDKEETTKPKIKVKVEEVATEEKVGVVEEGKKSGNDSDSATETETDDKEEKVEEVPESSDPIDEEETSDDEETDSDDSSTEDPPADTKEDKVKGKTLAFSFVAGFIIGGLITGGVFFYKSGVEDADSTPTPASTLSPTPIPTEEPVVDLSEYALQVLNGSGVSGVAGVVGSTLEGEGFMDVAVGNAGSSNFEETEVAVKGDVPAGVFEAIESALSDDYDVVEADDTLDEDGNYDVVVTVGAKK